MWSHHATAVQWEPLLSIAPIAFYWYSQYRKNISPQLLHDVNGRNCSPAVSWRATDLLKSLLRSNVNYSLIPINTHYFPLLTFTATHWYILFDHECSFPCKTASLFGVFSSCFIACVRAIIICRGTSLWCRFPRVANANLTVLVRAYCNIFGLAICQNSRNYLKLILIRSSLLSGVPFQNACSFAYVRVVLVTMTRCKNVRQLLSREGYDRISCENKCHLAEVSRVPCNAPCCIFQSNQWRMLRCLRRILGT